MPQRLRRRWPPPSLVTCPKPCAGGLLLTALLACAGHIDDTETDFDGISLLQVTGAGCSSQSSLVCRGRCFGGICLLGDMLIDSGNLLAENSASTWAPLAPPSPTHQAERTMLHRDAVEARRLLTLSAPAVPRSALDAPALTEQLPQQWEPVAEPEYARVPTELQPRVDERSLDTAATLRVLRSLELRLEDSGRAAVNPSQPRAIWPGISVGTGLASKLDGSAQDSGRAAVNPSQSRAIWPGISLGAGLASKLDGSAVDVDRGLGEIGLSATLGAAHTQQHSARSEDASDLGAISDKQIGVLVFLGLGGLSLTTCCLCFLCVDVNAKPAKTSLKEEEDEDAIGSGPLGLCGFCCSSMYTAMGPIGHMALLVALALTLFMVAFLIETNALQGIEEQLVSYGFLAEAVILVVALVGIIVYETLRKRYLKTKLYFDKRFKPALERLERTMNMANTYLSQLPGVDDAQDWLEDMTGFDLFDGNTSEEEADPNIPPEVKAKDKATRDKTREKMATAKAKAEAKKKSKKTGLCF